MIEELLEQGSYKEALKQLTDNDEQTRYYRLICLNGLGEYQKAKEEGHYALLLAHKTYYDVLCEYLTTLKNTQDFDEAIDLLIKELSMPYIQLEYEQMLNTAYDEILREKQETQLYSESKQIFSIEEIDLLLKNPNVNDDLLYMALDQFQDLNVRRLLSTIRLYLKDEQKPHFAKSLLLEILIEQDIDEEFEVIKNGHTFYFDPSIDSLCLERSSYDEIGHLLVNTLEHENPSLLESCLDFLEYYLYDIYPQIIYEEEYGKVAATIHYYVASLQGITLTMDDLYTYYHVNEDEIDFSLLALDNKE